MQSPYRATSFSLSSRRALPVAAEHLVDAIGHIFPGAKWAFSGPLLGHPNLELLFDPWGAAHGRVRSLVSQLEGLVMNADAVMFEAMSDRYKPIDYNSWLSEALTWN